MFYLAIVVTGKLYRTQEEWRRFLLSDVELQDIFQPFPSVTVYHKTSYDLHNDDDSEAGECMQVLTKTISLPSIVL